VQVVETVRQPPGLTGKPPYYTHVRIICVSEA
jgi:hypothetical protein